MSFLALVALEIEFALKKYIRVAMKLHLEQKNPPKTSVRDTVVQFPTV